MFTTSSVSSNRIVFSTNRYTQYCTILADDNSFHIQDTVETRKIKEGVATLRETGGPVSGQEVNIALS